MEERMPGFIQVMQAHEGDWWVVDDIRVIGVHLARPDDSESALDAAMDQARAASDNGCFATYGIGTVPRCHVSSLLHGYPGERPGADPGWVCRRGGWNDEDEEEEESGDVVRNA